MSQEQLKEEIRGNAFSEYRKAELEIAASFVHEIWTKDPQYVKGALDIFYRIIRIPAMLTGRDREEEALLISIAARDIKRFEMEILSQTIRDNSDDK